MMLADSLICCGKTLPHKARSFADLPGANQADLLLAELSNAPCPFAPVPADRPLALYGAGNLGRLARNHLKRVGQVLSWPSIAMPFNWRRNLAGPV